MGEWSDPSPVDSSGLIQALRVGELSGRALIDWAHSYNGYERLGAGPSELGTVLRPLQEEIETSGRIPEWAGVDLLRGLAFLRVRMAANREAPEYALDDHLFLAVAATVHNHPHALPGDRPPL